MYIYGSIIVCTIFCLILALILLIGHNNTENGKLSIRLSTCCTRTYVMFFLNSNFIPLRQSYDRFIDFFFNVNLFVHYEIEFFIIE